MFKLKNHSIKIVKISLFFALILCLMSTCFSWEASLTPLNFLNKWVDTAEKNIEINNSKWKAVVKNLYNNSLKQADLLKMSPMLTSVKSTTISLNDRYLCNIKDSDTINILYKSNDDFKKNLKNASQSVKKPTKSDMVKSCWTLMKCILTWYSGTPIVDSVDYCKMIVNDFYLKEYKTTYNSLSLTKWNEWLDAFRNKTLKDSSYDILNDAYILAKILFDSPEEPTEILFYEMPDTSVVNDTHVTAENNRFSPYYNIETGNDVDENWWNGNLWGFWWEIWDWNAIVWWQAVVYWDVDEDFLEFSETITHTTDGSDWYEFLGDDCIDWFTIEWYSWDTYTETIAQIISLWEEILIEEHIENIIEEINSLSCNHNLNCEPWELYTCEDCIDAPEDWDIEVPEDMRDFVDENPELSLDQKTLNCFSSCNSVPCTATNCGRLACYAKCLCLSYESSVFDPIETPGLWPIFRLKFCLQPVQDNKVVTSKKVNNLESIIREINIVIQNLRNSGQLMLNKKTKEFLDAGFQKNDFSKQISFSIDGFSKIPESDLSEKEKKEKQINLNTSLMETVLWFEKDAEVDGAWRNKYVIKWWQESTGSISTFDSQAETYKYMDNSILVSSLQSEHIADMWFHISEFLADNVNYWIFVKETLNSINTTANSLLNKKQQ